MHVALLIILIVIAILIYIILAGTTAKLLDVWDSDTEVLIFCVWWIVLPIYGLCKLYELLKDM